MKSHSCLSRCLLLLAAMLAAFVPADLRAQSPGSEAFDEFAQRMKEAMRRMVVSPGLLTDGPPVRAAFHEVVAGPSQWTVRVRFKDKDVALGMIAAADGYVLTKASQLPGEVACVLSDGRTLEARLVSVDKDHDLALLKIEASDLPSTAWNAGSVQVGQWVATPGLEREPLAVGVLSVGPRAIPKRSGLLGVRLGEASEGPLVVEVFPGSGAAEAGVEADDVITHVDGRVTRSAEALVRTVRGYAPGDEIELTLRRGEETIKTKATLTDGVQGIPMDRRDVQDNMGSKLSQRRAGFPSVLQHDTLLHPEDCGGPLVDLEGKAVGINIARAGRTESYAIPARDVLRLLPGLMAGDR